jgi:hypothetical protein
MHLICDIWPAVDICIHGWFLSEHDQLSSKRVGCTYSETNKELTNWMYEGESKIIRNVATYCAVGYTAGWT